MQQHGVLPSAGSGSAILDRLAPRYDAIVTSIYRAGSGVEPWLNPLKEIAAVFDAWSVQLLGVDKRTGVMSFSFEAGSAPPEAPVDYLRHYHRIDPRLSKHLPLPVGSWMACEEHFDAAFVERDPFYQNYLIPYGARYLYGTKLLDTESATVLIGHLGKVNNPPLSAAEKAAFARLTSHIAEAFDIHKYLAASAGQQSVGLELLEKMRQPIILISNERRITYKNRVAAKLIDRRDLLFVQDDVLTCQDADCDLDLTIAIRELGLVPITTHGAAVVPRERCSLRLKRKDGRMVSSTLLALRPETTMGSFGRVPQALFTLFEPGAAVEIDSFLLGTTFDLTPAEARLAAKIVNGLSPDDCARELGVKISTVRSQLMAIYGKTGATGQADLVRLVLSATAI